MRAGDDERIINYGWPYPDKNLVTILSVTLHYNSISSDNQNSFCHTVFCCCLFNPPLLSQILLMSEAYSESYQTSKVEQK